MNRNVRVKKTKNSSGRISVSKWRGQFILRRQGDEDIRVSFPGQGGLLNQPVTFQVEGRVLQFEGFSASLNGKSTNGWVVLKERSNVKNNRVIITQELKHPELDSLTRARFEVWISSRDKAVRFRIALAGKGQHLDYLGVGPHSGRGLGCKRMYFGTCVINGPIKPFEIGRPGDRPETHTMRSTNRYWTMEFENGLTEMQGMDVAPVGFRCKPGGSRAVYDMHTYCSSPVTYTFVVTSKGGQEAIRQHSKSLAHKATKALAKLPGRCIVMTWYPLRNNLEWWYREFAGRGARDLIWLCYTNWHNDVNRRMTDESNSLFCPYTNYIDYFDSVAEAGRRPSPDWAPEHCICEENGDFQRGYHQSTRLLPNLYQKWARRGKMWKGFFNLTDYREVMRANAFYFDVHAAIYPAHYFDNKGNHYSQREFLKHTSDLFALARRTGGDAPIFSEFGNEWLAEAMDGGAFNAVFGPAYWGIKGKDWEYYPNLDQVHRRHHLPVSVGHHGDNLNGEKDWGDRKSMFQRRAALNVLFGRSELIGCYWPTDLSRIDSRLMSYYLHSAFHRLLGTKGIREIGFAEGNLHHLEVQYDHGVKIRVNLRDREWTVEGRRLKEACYTIKGPRFLQYCEVPKGKDFCVEFVKSPDYWLFASPEMHDFGPASIHGAYAIRVPDINHLIVYEIRKTRDLIILRLREILGRPGPYKLKAIHTVFEGRRVRRDPVYEIRGSRIEDGKLMFEPSQDSHAWRYEIEIG